MSKILGMPVVRVISRYDTGKTGMVGRYATCTCTFYVKCTRVAQTARTEENVEVYET